MSHPEFMPSTYEGKLIRAEEEMAEAILAICKMRRFGEGSVNPLLPEDQQVTNIVHVKQELLDVWEAVDIILDTREMREVKW